jgi:hypothetical protein
VEDSWGRVYIYLPQWGLLGACLHISPQWKTPKRVSSYIPHSGGFLGAFLHISPQWKTPEGVSTYIPHSGGFLGAFLHISPQWRTPGGVSTYIPHSWGLLGASLHKSPTVQDSWGGLYIYPPQLRTSGGVSTYIPHSGGLLGASQHISPPSRADDMDLGWLFWGKMEIFGRVSSGARRDPPPDSSSWHSFSSREWADSRCCQQIAETEIERKR